MPIASERMRNAIDNFIIANTPAFLMKRLREDAYVQEISQKFSSQDILSALNKYAGAAPTIVQEKVTPLILLVALSLKPEVWPINHVNSSDFSQIRWFREITSLIRQMPATLEKNFSFPPVQMAGKPRTGTATKIKVIQKDFAT